MSELTPETLDKWLEDAFQSENANWSVLINYLSAWKADRKQLLDARDFIRRMGGFAADIGETR